MSNYSDDDPSYRYTAPGLAAAHTIADAATHGSPKARRRARFMAFVALAAMAAFLGMSLFTAFFIS